MSLKKRRQEMEVSRRLIDPIRVLLCSDESGSLVPDGPDRNAGSDPSRTSGCRTWTRTRTDQKQNPKLRLLEDADQNNQLFISK